MSDSVTNPGRKTEHSCLKVEVHLHHYVCTCIFVPLCLHMYICAIMFAHVHLCHYVCTCTFAPLCLHMYISAIMLHLRHYACTCTFVQLCLHMYIWYMYICAIMFAYVHLKKITDETFYDEKNILICRLR